MAIESRRRECRRTRAEMRRELRRESGRREQVASSRAGTRRGWRSRRRAGERKTRDATRRRPGWESAKSSARGCGQADGGEQTCSGQTSNRREEIWTRSLRRICRHIPPAMGRCVATLLAMHVHWLKNHAGHISWTDYARDIEKSQQCVICLSTVTVERSRCDQTGDVDASCILVPAADAAQASSGRSDKLKRAAARISIQTGIAATTHLSP